MASRTQSIRTKIVILLVVPLVSFTGLWAYVAVTTYSDSVQMLRARTFDQNLVRPTQELIVALQHERRMSVAFLGGDSSLDRSGFLAQRAATDRARAAYIRGSTGAQAREVVDEGTRRRLDDLRRRLGEVDTLRAQIDARQVGRPRALADYSSLVDVALNVYKGTPPPKDAGIAQDLDNLLRLGAARELLGRADSLATGALLHGRFTAAEFEQFEQLTAAYRHYYADLEPSLKARDRDRYQDFVTSPQYSRYRTLENRLLAFEGRRGPIPVDAGTWHTASEAVIVSLREFERQALADTTRRSRETAIGVFTRLGLATGLGLLAFLVSAAVAWRIARRMVTESRTMADAVTEFTGHYLPALADSVRKGEPIDLDRAIPSPHLTITEIDRISASFTAAGREVIAATKHELEARRAINEVFVVLARRSQALLHRQLNLLDSMQRRTEEPAELTDLFQLDHLATRMRRHAEGLVIMAGKSAGRTWRTPVPFIDVVRGAVAEVEDYTRVRVLPMPGAALSGTAVADMIHLLAELVENATLFSSPQSPVEISGQVVSSGYAIEIEDRGLGLEPEALAEINQRLLDPPEVNLSDMARLGLFVVARLARRHDVRVSLRASPYGGTTAIVLVPSALIVEPAAEGRVPGDLRVTPPGLGVGVPEPEPVRRPEPVPSPAPTPPAPAPEPYLAMALSGEQEALPRRRRQSREPGAQTGAPEELPRRTRQSREPGAQTGAPEELPRRTRQDRVPGAQAGAPDELPRRRVSRAASAEEPAGPVPLGAPVPASPAPGRQADRTGEVPGPAEEDERRPEVLRTRMAAMQRGWQRGRLEARRAGISDGEAGESAAEDKAASGTEEDGT
ncbi:hypothetical protein DPM19_20545 [Actinomadura craniellae]|uniref:histidine kinase n=1 Tax=Actinomadura craniellae TaxID=2231787 RepID=A0A365H2Y1_9ACTN|nr:nitrate- and nitrite sensing domain-containing protein [Actinomadura craniellae]RAY13451.1 hypothetical protein DPM19_20545 [Actinomadura craniellae]